MMSGFVLSLDVVYRIYIGFIQGLCSLKIEYDCGFENKWEMLIKSKKEKLD